MASLMPGRALAAAAVTSDSEGSMPCETFVGDASGPCSASISSRSSSPSITVNSANGSSSTSDSAFAPSITCRLGRPLLAALQSTRIAQAKIVNAIEADGTGLGQTLLEQVLPLDCHVVQLFVHLTFDFQSRQSFDLHHPACYHFSNLKPLSTVSLPNMLISITGIVSMLDHNNEVRDTLTHGESHESAIMAGMPL